MNKSNKFFSIIRMHSSRIRADPAVTRMRNGRVAMRPIVDRMTDACKNITFPTVGKNIGCENKNNFARKDTIWG